MNSARDSRIFISYSHRGNGPEWKAWLVRHLGVFEQHHLLDVWQDGKIRVSSFWNDDIEQAMRSARLAVILLTKEALESQYVVEVEFPFLRDRQQRDKMPVFPVICEECDWRTHDWLRATQAPNESNPLSQLTEPEQDRILRQLATDIAVELSRVVLAELPKPDEPLSPEHVYLDKFPLTKSTGPREEKLIGREQELALLDLAFAQPNTAIVSLVAWGGVGKTMLVQHWLQRLQREGWFGARRVYAWSFYSQGTKEDRQASEDTFLAHALEWFGVQCEPTLSPWDKGRLLADAVARERTLLILDGIEPLQYPPGPMGGQLRAPGVQSLLKQLARKANATQSQISNHQSEIPKGLCLVTTREPLTDLADFQRREGSSWGSVLRVDLGNLTEEAGAALLHHAGAKRAGAAVIKPDDTELLAASREVGGHALTLNLLGRFLARAHGGDIRRRDLVKFEEADRKEQGGTTFKMLAAFENWFAKSGEFGARQLAVLRMLGLFDRPADAGCIGALRKLPVIAGLTDPLFTTKPDASTGQTTVQPLVEEDWNTATSFLADFDLVVVHASYDDRERLLDCHPLIREYFAKQLNEKRSESWHAAHRRLYEHLCTTTEDSKPNPTLEGLQPLYQAVAHGCQAALQQDACDKIFYERIRQGNNYYSVRNLGAFGSDLGAIACFVELPWIHVSPAVTEADRAWLLNEAASSLRALSRLKKALEPIQAGLELHVKQGNWREAANSANNFSEIELTLGDVDGALSHARNSVTYADRSGSWTQRIIGRTRLADALHQGGRVDDAEDCFREAEQLNGPSQSLCPLLYGLAGFQYCDLLLGESQRAAWQIIYSDGLRPPNEIAAYRTARQTVSKRAAQTLKIAERNNWLLDIALDHLTLGHAALFAGTLEGSSLDPCRALVQHAVDGLRRSGYQYMLVLGLLTRARLRFLMDARTGPEGARADMDEAWDIAERGPMRLHMADIHLHRARLFFREKPYPWKSPQADLAAAEKLINDCGYHRRDEELADAKRAILGS